MSLDAFDTLAAPRPEMQADPEDTPLLQWLRAQRTGPRVALYASGAAPGGVFLHAVLIPRGQRERPWDDLNEWSGNPFDHPSCGLVYGGGQGARVELHAPWDDSQPEVLLGAQQLVFGRAFDGRIGTPTYSELAQAITLSHDLHWLEERQAWCRFDDAGDLRLAVRRVREHPDAVRVADGEDAGHVRAALRVRHDAPPFDEHAASAATIPRVMSRIASPLFRVALGVDVLAEPFPVDLEVVSSIT